MGKASAGEDWKRTNNPKHLIGIQSATFTLLLHMAEYKATLAVMIANIWETGQGSWKKKNQRNCNSFWFWSPKCPKTQHSAEKKLATLD